MDEAEEAAFEAEHAIAVERFSENLALRAAGRAVEAERDEALAELSALRLERDGLVEALEEIESCASGCNSTVKVQQGRAGRTADGDEGFEWITNRARAALANREGTEPPIQGEEPKK